MVSEKKFLLVWCFVTKQQSNVIHLKKKKKAATVKTLKVLEFTLTDQFFCDGNFQLGSHSALMHIWAAERLPPSGIFFLSSPGGRFISPPPPFLALLTH